MNIAARQSIEWTTERYLAWETQQETRYEFDGFEPVAMVGGKIARQRVIRATERALRRRTRCEVFSETVKFQVAENKFRYPDLMVVCSQPSGEATYVIDPVVVIEVLSDGNADDDRITKNQEYSMVESVQHYVMLEQSRPAATVFSRSGDDWIGHLLVGEGAVLRLPAIEAEIPLRELYTPDTPVSDREEA